MILSGGVIADSTTSQLSPDVAVLKTPVSEFYEVAFAAVFND
jgi:hypothetical protein